MRRTSPETHNAGALVAEHSSRLSCFHGHWQEPFAHREQAARLFLAAPCIDPVDGGDSMLDLDDRHEWGGTTRLRRSGPLATEVAADEHRAEDDAEDDGDDRARIEPLSGQRRDRRRREQQQQQLNDDL